MTLKVYIADDDPAIQQMLIRIVKDHGLGQLVGYTSDGAQAIQDILTLTPDIVLIDLLMPKVDGIEAMLAAKAQGTSAAFIMISQVDHHDMVTRAYAEGVEYYIKKPLNVLEVIRVIGQVREKLQMAALIQNYKSNLNEHSPKPLSEKADSTLSKTMSNKQSLKRLLAQLGILGEAGCQDLVDIVMWLKEQSLTDQAQPYKLSQAYDYVVGKYESGHQMKINSSTVEQRVRRAIKSALNHLAHLGLEDYYDSIFTRYSSTLFDFSEVKSEMDYERGKSKYGGKINAKKFFEGLIVQLDEEMDQQ